MLGTILSVFIDGNLDYTYLARLLNNVPTWQTCILIQGDREVRINGMACLFTWSDIIRLIMEIFQNMVYKIKLLDLLNSRRRKNLLLDRSCLRCWVTLKKKIIQGVFSLFLTITRINSIAYSFWSVMKLLYRISVIIDLIYFLNFWNKSENTQYVRKYVYLIRICSFRRSCFKICD